MTYLCCVTPSDPHAAMRWSVESSSPMTAPLTTAPSPRTDARMPPPLEPPFLEVHAAHESSGKVLSDIAALSEQQMQHHRRMDSQFSVLAAGQLQHQRNLDALRQLFDRVASGNAPGVAARPASTPAPDFLPDPQDLGFLREQVIQLSRRLDDHQVVMQSFVRDLPNICTSMITGEEREDSGVAQRESSRQRGGVVRNGLSTSDVTACADDDGQELACNLDHDAVIKSHGAALAAVLVTEGHTTEASTSVVCSSAVSASAQAGQVVVACNELLGAFCGQRFHSSRGDAEAALWQERRQEVLSEFSFDAKTSSKALMYETLPEGAAALLCSVVDGKNQAKARNLLPWKPPKDLLGIGGCWILLALSFYVQPEGVNIFDSISIMILVFVRASTVACKYGTYGDFATKSFFASDAYRASNRVWGMTMGNYIVNLGGGKKAMLLEQLYASQLKCDSDLSCVRVRLASVPAARKLWDEVLGDLAEVQAVTQIQVVATSVAEGDGCKHLSKGDSIRDGSKQLSEIVLPSKFAADHGGLVAEMFRRTAGETEDDVSHGEISGFAFAYHCVCRSHGNTTRLGMLVMACCFCWSAVVALIPCTVNYFMGIPPMGPTQWSMVVLIMQAWYFSPLFTLITYYVVAPCMFFALQVRQEIYLNGAITEGNSHRDYPAIDLKIPENVIAWGALWRVLHGPNFSSTFQYRSQFYLVLSFGAIVLDSALQGFAFQMDPDNLPVSSKIQSFVRLLSMALVVCAEIVLAHTINQFAGKNAAELGRVQRHIQSVLDCEPAEDEARQLRRSLALLAQLSNEIIADVAYKPVCVGFLRGDIKRLSTVGTLLAALMYADLLVLRSQLGLESVGFPIR